MIFCLCCLSIYTNNTLAKTKPSFPVTQSEAKDLIAAGEKRQVVWTSEHVKAGGNKDAYSTLTITTKRHSSTNAATLITLVSSERKIYFDAPDIDLYIKPVVTSVDNNGLQVKKAAGPETQLRSGKSSPTEIGKSGKQAEFLADIQVEANANAIEVITKIIGKSDNQNYESIVPLAFEISSSSVGGSSSVESSFFKEPSYQLSNLLSFANYTPATSNSFFLIGCRTVTVSCSCTGCLGCSISKKCQDSCPNPTSSSCDPNRGTCSLTCCECS